MADHPAPHPWTMTDVELVRMLDAVVVHQAECTNPNCGVTPYAEAVQAELDRRIAEALLERPELRPYLN